MTLTLTAFCNFLVFLGGMLAFSVGHRICDSQVTGSSPGWAGQAAYTCVPLSHIG